MPSFQLRWLNTYYDTIRKVMGPELDRQGLTREKDWMLKNTQPFSASPGRVSSSSLIVIALAFALLHNILWAFFLPPVEEDLRTNVTPGQSLHSSFTTLRDALQFNLFFSFFFKSFLSLMINVLVFGS